MDNAVLVAMPTATGRPHFESLHSASRQKRADASDAFHVFPGGAAPVQTVRNAIVKTLMDGEWSHLLFVDDDVVVPDNALPRLMAVDADIVTGIVPTLLRGTVGLVFNIQTDDGLWYRQSAGEVVDIGACGMACALVRREVFAALGWPYFHWLETEEGAILGEDLTFCARAKEAGFALRADTTVICDHIKNMHLLRFLTPGGPLLMDKPADDVPIDRVYTAV